MYEYTSGCGVRPALILVRLGVAAHSAGKRYVYEAEQRECHPTKAGLQHLALELYRLARQTVLLRRQATRVQYVAAHPIA